jgi:hypothetical protein
LIFRLFYQNLTWCIAVHAVRVPGDVRLEGLDGLQIHHAGARATSGFYHFIALQQKSKTISFIGKCNESLERSDENKTKNVLPTRMKKTANTLELSIRVSLEVK